MVSSVEKGDSFEDVIYKYLVQEIDSGRLPFRKDSCKVFKKKKYYSKDRGSDIEFDVVIEVYFPGTQDCSLIYIFECKNYSSSVGVEQVESFYMKAEQVAGAKSKLVLATKGPIQRAARAFALSRGMGVLRYFGSESLKWEAYRLPSTSLHSAGEISIYEFDAALSEPDFKSRYFDIYFQTSLKATVSAWEFIYDIVYAGDPGDFNLASSSLKDRTDLVSSVPYLEKGEIEAIASSVLGRIGYRGGAVDPERICSSVPDVSLEFYEESKTGVIGRINFSKSRIEIYKTQSRERNRFTVSHEISHLLLGHGKYIARDLCDEEDIGFENYSRVIPEDIKRIEHQANLLAASLLMPKEDFTNSFFYIRSVYGIRNKGFGYLFLDEQECNFGDYLKVISYLKNRYGVSKAATHIRLLSLELLVDGRK